MKVALIAVTLSLALLSGGSGAAAQGVTVNPTAKLLADFSARVKQYADLRNGLEKGEARLRQTDDPAKLVAAQDALAAKIRTARSNAKLGDIFIPAVRPIFRRLLSPKLKGPDGKQNKEAILDDNPGAIPFKVNGPYPKMEPLSTVPPDILRALPALPEDVEYRFVGKHLILYDARASLIVDFIPNAML